MIGSLKHKEILLNTITEPLKTKYKKEIIATKSIHFKESIDFIKTSHGVQKLNWKDFKLIGEEEYKILLKQVILNMTEKKDARLKLNLAQLEIQLIDTYENLNEQVYLELLQENEELASEKLKLLLTDGDEYKEVMTEYQNKKTGTNPLNTSEESFLDCLKKQLSSLTR